MTGLMDMLGAALGGNTQQQLAQQIGADPQQTGNAIQAALPMLLSGLTQNASQPGGAEALHGALQRDHDGSLLDSLGGLLGGASGGLLAGVTGGILGGANNQPSDGAGILGHVLGDRQEAAHQAVAQSSGLNAGQVAALMTTLAPIVMGALGKIQRTHGLDAGGLASMLQGEHAQASAAQPGLMGLASQLLDRNRDGNAMDDVMKGLGGLLGRS